MTLLSRLGALLTPASAAEPETEAQLAIRRGDAARDRRDWSAAAGAYRAALAHESGLPHIWVQTGHALKEQADLLGAVNAYQQALILKPGQPDTHVHLAHVYKGLGHYDLAISHFLHALHFGLAAPAEERELLHFLAQKVGKGRHAEIESLAQELMRLPQSEAEAPLLAKLRAVLAYENSRAAAEQSDDAGDALTMVFDISDLISFWRNARLPTGIQRVQIETIEGALSRGNGRRIRLCCFINGRDDWLEVPVEEFRRLADLATSGGDLKDREWLGALSNFDLHLSLTRPFVFPIGAVLVNLGTSWWLQNYFLFVRHAKLTRNIRYIPFVHDMIPIMTPQYCTRTLTQDFISWALGVFDHADHFLVNSQATSGDLQKVAGILGHSIDPADIAVIPLDSDFRKVGHEQLSPDALAQWNLREEDFILFVSTVESRKGHLQAFEAWVGLIDKLGTEKVPQLVCVGNRGWLNDKVYERLATDSVLARKVTMLSGLSDAELALLYRTCRFTVYPSLYEGWGLPVTESLCYGKVPLISDAASLPEAGGPFAVYARAGSTSDLEREAGRLITDEGHRATLEARIRAEFRPRSWSDLAGQIVEELDRFVARDAKEADGADTLQAAPVARIGCWYSMARNRSTRIWHGMGTAEGFRSGLGWFWPEDRGCRVKGSGGDFVMRIDQPHGPLRLMIGLRGDENEQCTYVISCDEAWTEGALELNETLWTWLEIPGSDTAHDCLVQFIVRPTAEGNLPTYFVRGFHLCESTDDVARQNFLEAVALGRLDMLDAYRERGTFPHSTGNPLHLSKSLKGASMKPQIKLFQTAVGDAYVEMLGISSEANRQYCDRHGIELETFVGIKRGYFPWQSTFNRIVYLHDQLEAGYRGWIFYLDADAFVYNHAFDVSDLIARQQGDFYFAPGGLTGERWDVNAGVFLINLGSDAGRALIEAWYTHFMSTPEEAMRDAPDWGMVADDQERLHDILRHRTELSGRLAMVPRKFFNDEHASFVRQVLRSNAETMEERIEKLKAGVAEAVAGVGAAAPLATRSASQLLFGELPELSAGDALGLAHRYAQENQLPAATALAEMALCQPEKLGEKEVNARVLLASLRERQGQFEAAAHAIAQAVRLSPGNDAVRADQDRILSALSQAGSSELST